MIQNNQPLSLESRIKEFTPKAIAWKEKKINHNTMIVALLEKKELVHKKRKFNVSSACKEFIESNLSDRLKTISAEIKSERVQLAEELERIQKEMEEEGNKVTRAIQRGIAPSRIAPGMNRLNKLKEELITAKSKLKKNLEKNDKHMKEYDSAAGQLREEFVAKMQVKKEEIQAEIDHIQSEEAAISAERRQIELERKNLVAERAQLRTEVDQLKAPDGVEAQLMRETEQIKLPEDSSEPSLERDPLEATPAFLTQPTHQKRVTQLRQSGIQLNEIKHFLSDSKNVARINQGLERKFVGIDKALKNATGNHIELELERNGQKISVHLHAETHFGKDVISYSVDKSLKDDFESLRSLCRLAIFSAEAENRPVAFTVNENHPHKDKIKEYLRSAIQEVAARHPESASQLTINGDSFEGQRKVPRFGN